MNAAKRFFSCFTESPFFYETSCRVRRLGRRERGGRGRTTRQTQNFL